MFKQERTFVNLMDSEFYKSVYNCFFIQKKGNSNVSETKEK